MGGCSFHVYYTMCRAELQEPKSIGLGLMAYGKALMVKLKLSPKFHIQGVLGINRLNQWFIDFPNHSKRSSVGVLAVFCGVKRSFEAVSQFFSIGL